MVVEIFGSPETGRGTRWRPEPKKPVARALPTGTAGKASVTPFGPFERDEKGLWAVGGAV